MKIQELISRVGYPVLGVLLIAVAYQTYGWPGVLAALGAVVMWALLQFTRMMQVLRRAKDLPIGFVGSAVMLNAKLSKGQTLLHVIALTRSIGLLQSEKGAQPEVFRWTDASESSVTVELQNGKVTSWAMVRPPVASDAPDAPSLPNAPDMPNTPDGSVVPSDPVAAKPGTAAAPAKPSAST